MTNRRTGIDIQFFRNSSAIVLSTSLCSLCRGGTFSEKKSKFHFAILIFCHEGSSYFRKTTGYLNEPTNEIVTQLVCRKGKRILRSLPDKDIELSLSKIPPALLPDPPVFEV